MLSMRLRRSHIIRINKPQREENIQFNVLITNSRKQGRSVTQPPMEKENLTKILYSRSHPKENNQNQSTKTPPSNPIHRKCSSRRIGASKGIKIMN
jgi:hypothetical protein